MRHVWAALMVAYLGLVPAWLSSPHPVRAQSETAYDLINTINTLRASLGLGAYTIDPWLMTYAQQHADYLDSLNYGTHEHSDGTLPWDIGVQENVASGTTDIMTAAIVVYQIWVDEIHLRVMTGYTSGSIGSGVAYSADDGQTYYVIDVRPGEDTATITPIIAAPAPTDAFVPLVTSTPRADGWIVHTVAEGQTLWSIAISYGTTVNAIRELNGLPADSTLVYVGQELSILQGVAIRPTQLTALPTIAPVFQPTSISPSATMLPTSTVTIPPSPSPSSTPANVLERLPPNRLTGAIVLISIGVIGLFIVIRFGFVRTKPPRSLR